MITITVTTDGSVTATAGVYTGSGTYAANGSFEIILSPLAIPSNSVVISGIIAGDCSQVTGQVFGGTACGSPGSSAPPANYTAVPL
jgi:hypothetical protein